MDKPLKFSTIKEGILLKRSGNKYKKFWVVVGASSLYFYKKPKKTDEVIRIPLVNINISTENTNKPPYPFEISLPDGSSYILASYTKEERKEWIEILSSFIEAILSDNENEEEILLTSKPTFAFKREKLLVSYRYMKNQIAQQAIPRFIYLPNEEVMHRFGYEIAIRKLFKTFASLDTLYFKDCQIGGDCMTDLVNFLDSYPQITSIIFENTGKGFSADRFIPVIPFLPSSISCIKFISSLSLKGVQGLKLSLMNHEYLKSLLLKNVSLKSEIVPLMQTINTSSIETLEIENIDLGDTGVNAIFTILKSNHIIHNLTLSQVSASRNCKESLNTFVSSDNSLTSLNLSGNKLGDAVDCIFSALLGSLSNLKHLNLSDTKLSHNSIFNLCKVLKDNEMLYSLDISDNKLKEESAKILCVALGNNSALCDFNITNAFKNVKPEDLQEINNHIKENVNNSRNKPVPSTVDKRSPLSLIKENRKRIELLGLFLGIDIVSYFTPKNINDNPVWISIENLINEAISLKKIPEDISFYEFLDQQEIKYTLGENRELILEIIKFLCVSQILKERVVSHTEINTVTKESYMHKRGVKMKNWKKRWFCLSGHYLFYYVNSSKHSHKGTILLEDSWIEGTCNGLTEYSFIIGTPNREYILSCESDEQRLSWIEHIQASQVKSTSETNAPLGQFKGQVQSFSNVFISKIMEPHRLWILQWWFPICLEVLSRFYIRRHRESFTDIEEFFIQQSKIAILLLTGEYLYKRKFVRGFEGLIRVSYEEENTKRFHEKRIENIRNEFFSDFNAFSTIDLYSILFNLSDNQLLITPQTIYSHKLSAMDSLKITNVLLDMDELNGVIQLVLAKIDPFTLSTILYIEEKHLRETQEENQRTRRNTVYGQGYKYITGDGEYRNFVFPPSELYKKSSNTPIEEILYLLQEIQLASTLFKPTYIFLNTVEWLSINWPQSKDKRSTDIPVQKSLFSLRMVFILWHVYLPLKQAPVSLDDIYLYNKWTEYRTCIEETIIHLASCAIYSFDGADQILEKTFEFILVSTKSILTTIMASLLKTDQNIHIDK